MDYYVKILDNPQKAANAYFLQFYHPGNPQKSNLMIFSAKQSWHCLLNILIPISLFISSTPKCWIWSPAVCPPRPKRASHGWSGSTSRGRTTRPATGPPAAWWAVAGFWQRAIWSGTSRKIWPDGWIRSKWRVKQKQKKN